MKPHHLIAAVHLCAIILKEVAVQLNGGRPPTRPVPLRLDVLSDKQASAFQKLLSKSRPGCALVGCKRSNRTKGYCAAHYQKLRLLEKTRRRPFTWVDYAEPGTVKDIALPRGRAGSKALAEARGEE